MKISSILLVTALGFVSMVEAQQVDPVEILRAKQGELIEIKLFEGGQLMSKWTCTQHDTSILDVAQEPTYTIDPTIPGPECDGGFLLTLRYYAVKKGETFLSYVCKSRATQQQLAIKHYKVTIE